MDRQEGRRDERNEMPETLQPSAAAAFLNGPVLGALTRGSEVYGRALFSWQSELLRFAGERLRNDTEFGQSLIGCRDWTDASRLQQAWLSSTLQDYVDEAGRLFRLASGLAGDVAETSREESRTVAEQGAHWAKRARKETGRAAAHSRPRRRQRKS
jgi:Phasin protein